MRPGSPIGRANGQASLLTAILMLAVLTVVGIALEFTTGAHRAGAATEWAISRAYYAADAGIRWATVELRDPAAFLSRPEFQDPSNPFGAVAVPLPSHDHGNGGLFSGDPQEEGIRVTVQKPGLLGRRPCVTDAGESGLFFYLFEVRARAAGIAPAPGYTAEIVADVEVGPLSADFPGAVPPGAEVPSASQDIIGTRSFESKEASCEPARAFRSVSMNWRER